MFGHDFSCVDQFLMPLGRFPEEYDTLYKTNRSMSTIRGQYSNLRQMRITRGLDRHGKIVPVPNIEHAICSHRRERFGHFEDFGGLVLDPVRHVAGMLATGGERMHRVGLFQRVDEVFRILRWFPGRLMCLML